MLSKSNRLCCQFIVAYEAVRVILSNVFDVKTNIAMEKLGDKIRHCLT